MSSYLFIIKNTCTYFPTDVIYEAGLSHEFLCRQANTFFIKKKDLCLHPFFHLSFFLHSYFLLSKHAQTLTSSSVLTYELHAAKFYYLPFMPCVSTCNGAILPHSSTDRHLRIQSCVFCGIFSC